MNYQAWLQLLLAAVGTANPQIGALVALVTGGIQTITADTAEDKALIAQWFAFCQKIVDENRAPTPEEHAAAKAFADAEHVHNQLGDM